MSLFALCRVPLDLMGAPGPLVNVRSGGPAGVVRGRAMGPYAVGVWANIQPFRYSCWQWHAYDQAARPRLCTPLRVIGHQNTLISLGSMVAFFSAVAV